MGALRVMGETASLNPEGGACIQGGVGAHNRKQLMGLKTSILVPRAFSLPRPPSEESGGAGKEKALGTRMKNQGA